MPKFSDGTSRQIVHILLKEPSDQVLYFLPINLCLSGTIFFCGKISLFKFCFTAIILDGQKLETLCIFFQEFIAQTLSSCEVLELSSSNLYVAAERLQTLGPSKEAKAKLVQASKDVLQGTMKVSLFCIAIVSSKMWKWS